MKSWADELQIGQPFRVGTGPKSPLATIKELHELCPEFDGPHVHVLHTLGHSCIPFPKPQKKFRAVGEWSGPVWNLKERPPVPDFKALARKMAAFNQNMQEVMGKFHIPEPPKVGDRVQMTVHGTQTGRFPPPAVLESERKQKR